MNPKPQHRLFATIAGGWRTSWFGDMDVAIEYAIDMLGVDFVEEIGVGNIWCKCRDIPITFDEDDEL